MIDLEMVCAFNVVMMLMIVMMIVMMIMMIMMMMVQIMVIDGGKMNLSCPLFLTTWPCLNSYFYSGYYIPLDCNFHFGNKENAPPQKLTLNLKIPSWKGT